MNKNSAYSSERLTYRGISIADTADIVRWRSNPSNYHNFFSASPVTVEDHLEWFGRYLKDPTRYDFIIVDGEGRNVGTVGLSSIKDESCEINYMIGEESARGKGYAKEAVHTMTGVAVHELGVLRVDALILPHNKASMRVVAGCGYGETERIYSFFADGGKKTGDS